jgi:hypothetical protein
MKKSHWHTYHVHEPSPTDDEDAVQLSGSTSSVPMEWNVTPISFTKRGLRVCLYMCVLSEKPWIHWSPGCTMTGSDMSPTRVFHSTVLSSASYILLYFEVCLHQASWQNLHPSRLSRQKHQNSFIRDIIFYGHVNNNGHEMNHGWDRRWIEYCE